EPSPCPLSEPSPLPLEKDDKTEAPLLSHAPAPGTAERVESSASASPEDSAAIPKPLMTLSMVIGVLLGIGIFIVLPAIVTNLLVGD
ncbi:MAG: hypothetical protein LBP28_01200, partial [Coriobacteriales bacterium]|nr:hypothetical protein [Coriobacteriales bacterium]